jgi:hypothetical protein
LSLHALGSFWYFSMLSEASSIVNTVNWYRKEADLWA